jgi:hypothetical protein
LKALDDMMSRAFDLKIFAFIFILAFQISAKAADRNKVEELFLWKISDELKLTMPEEKALAEFTKAQNEKKNKLNEQTKENLKSISDAGSDNKKLEKLLAEHRKIIKAYNDLSLDEMDQIQKKLGVAKAGQYLVLKNDLTNRLKALLSNPEKSAVPSAKLSAPQVIEEK